MIAAYLLWNRVSWSVCSNELSLLIFCPKDLKSQSAYAWSKCVQNRREQLVVVLVSQWQNRVVYTLKGIKIWKRKATVWVPHLFPTLSCNGKRWKLYCCELALSSEPQIWKLHVVFRQTTTRHCTKKRAERAARLVFLIQPIKSLICGVVVAVAVVKS